MRNGNVSADNVVKKPSSVLTVPMRNGNSTTRGTHSREQMVLTVPMRNGNYDRNIAIVDLCMFLPYL